MAAPGGRWRVRGMRLSVSVRQRGAIVIMTALALLATLVAAALAVDLGRLAYEKRRLQGVADAAALDAARAFGPCVAQQGDPAAAAQASANRNGFDGNIAVATGVVRAVNGVYGDLEAAAAGEVVDAVQVTATRQVRRSYLAGAVLPGNVTLTARAIARTDALGGLRAGSFLARVDSSQAPILNALLGGLLGTSLALDAVAYNGLAGSHVTLLDLVNAQADAGTVQELLDAELGMTGFLRLLATALENNGNAAAVTLNNLALVTASQLGLRLGDLLQVAQGGERAALQAALNVFDLVAMAAQVVNTQHAVDLNFLGVTLPGIASLTARLTVIEPPQVAIGPPGRDKTGAWRTEVRTAQVRLELHLSALEQLNLIVAQVGVNLDTFVEAAQTTAWLETIQCATRADPVYRVTTGVQPGIARIGIGTLTGTAAAPSELLNVRLQLLLPIAEVKATALADVSLAAPEAQTVAFQGPFVPAIAEPSAANTQTVGTALGTALANALGGLLASADIRVDLKVLGILPVGLSVTSITQGLNELLQPVIASLDVLLVPLFQALGISLGGADVTVVFLDPTQPHLAR